VAEGDGFKPAPINVIQRTMRMATALKRWIERQGTKVPVEIEPVLIAGDPGLHIESVRPAIKVMMIDGIKSYVSGLATGHPALSTEAIYELTERIINPRPPRKDTPAAAAPMPQEDEYGQQPQQEVSRARAIFDASQEAPFSPSDLILPCRMNPPLESLLPPPHTESNPAQPCRSETKQQKIRA
jgi:hypothetical protein